MLPAVVILAIIVLIPLLYVIGVYNRLINLRNTVAESWRNVDTELQRRYDLIPNLVETVKGYAAHERAVFEAVAQARAAAVASKGSPGSQAADENMLVRALGSLFAVAESYPQLKAAENFLRLQEELINTEDRIQAARRFYNGNVRTLNNLIQMFPSSAIASAGNFAPAEFFEIESVSMRQPVKGIALTAMDHHHYERAFETWLRRRRAPYVAIEQVRRSADQQGPIKSFDFLVHAGRKHYIVDVKGKRFPQVSAGRETWWENWVHFADIEGLFAWENHFGADYEALLVYCYWLQAPAAEGPARASVTLNDREYLLVAVSARAFAEHCRRRSARWKAVHVPEKDFTRLIRPAEFYIPGTVPPSGS